MQTPNIILPISIQPSNRKGCVSVEFDAGRFERLASDLGLFTNEYILSLKTAEIEIRNKKTKVLRSLADLRSQA